MCQPLSVPGAGCIPHAAASDMAEVDVEARVPSTIAHDFVVGQVMDFIDRMAEAGRTYQGAVSAA